MAVRHGASDDDCRVLCAASSCVAVSADFSAENRLHRSARMRRCAKPSRLHRSARMRPVSLRGEAETTAVLSPQQRTTSSAAEGYILHAVCCAVLCCAVLCSCALTHAEAVGC